ncbi:chloride channel protein [Anaeromyxobacter oryzae]|uniref:Voltage-gated ClC-type chloride channel ClcB n=1 Tax=Anaeromyxobacter oryzae TaxID=2918170 RepID=A0ABN6MZA6_9BACT|nr:chloride channel protein [Anaeromyxobacter oryzae]BDG06272.1 voltage-gated ClC-type chloride channel ClcB [Anaeromyxobacter oryzae]
MNGAEPQIERGPLDGGTSPPLFFGSLRDFLRVLPAAAQRFWFLVIATGFLSGLGSGVLLWLLSVVQRVAWPPAERFVGAVAMASPLRRVLVPAGAGVLVSLSMLLWPQLRGGHGTARIIEAIWHRGRGLLLGRTLLRGFLSIVSVGSGASLGREGALVQTGAAAGSWLAERLRLTERQTRVLVACGAASGIAAAYDVPIGGALFGLEVLLGSFALELLGPIVVACVVATATARTLPLAHTAYVIPEYALLDVRELFLGLALAPVLGLSSAIYVRVMGWVEVRFERLPRWTQPFLPVLGLATVGTLAIRFPELLGNGFDTVHQMLLGAVPLELLLVLPLLKLGATALCAGTGVPGGLFTPSLFFGAAIGGAAGQLLSHFFPGLAPPGALALVGMAGVLAGTTHAAVSSVLILFEMTGDYGVILPLMLCAAVAAGTSRAIEPDSLYTAPLRRRGTALPELPRPGWLRAMSVTALVHPDAERVPPAMPFEALVKKLLSLAPGHDLYVTDDEGRLLGVIQLDALKGTISDQADLGMIVAADVVDREVEPVTTSMTVAEVAARFGVGDLERLPVVDGEKRLLGTISMRDLLARGTF